MLVFYIMVQLSFEVSIHLSSAFFLQPGTSGANVFFYSAPCLHFVVMMKLSVCRSAPAPS